MESLKNFYKKVGAEKFMGLLDTDIKVSQFIPGQTFYIYNQDNDYQLFDEDGNALNAEDYSEYIKHIINKIKKSKYEYSLYQLQFDGNEKWYLFNVFTKEFKALADVTVKTIAANLDLELVKTLIDGQPTNEAKEAILDILNCPEYDFQNKLFECLFDGKTVQLLY